MGLLILVPSLGEAHTRGTSYSWWTLDDHGAQVRARVSSLELTRLQLYPGYTPDYLSAAAAVMAASLTLHAAGQSCAASDVTAVEASGWIEARWTLRCGPGPRTLRSTLLAEVAPGHLHFVRVTSATGKVQQRVLTANAPELAIDQPPSAGSFVMLGAEHILSGWDHLAFVLALLLLCASLREVVLVATGFTVAHSLSLALAVLGAVKVASAPVEALIALSIVLAGAEGLWARSGRGRAIPGMLAAALVLLAASGAGQLPPLLPAAIALFAGCYFALVGTSARPDRWRAAMGFTFGLAHGLGFAGALSVLELPGGELAAGLFGFNAGVELGQLAVIALAWPLLRFVARKPALDGWSRDLAGSAVCALGCYWFVLRTFG